MIALQSRIDPSTRWLLYARSPVEGLAEDAVSRASIVWRCDGLPRHLGRLLSPYVAAPYWAWRDQPQVYWGPAHKLPVWLPPTTRAVLTVHDMIWLHAGHTMRPVSRWIEPGAMAASVRRAHAIISVSQSTAQDIAAHWPQAKERLRVIPLGIPEFPPAPALEVVHPRLMRRGYFLFVGTFEPRKNLPRLLAAYAKASAARPDLPLLALAGRPGWGTPDLMRHAQRLGISERVVWLGYVPEAALSALYDNAQALVMPSLMEGFGLPLVESLHHGVPVLASHSSSMPEVLGEAGMLVDPLSEDSIAEGLLALATDSRTWQAMAGRAQGQAARFSWNQAAQSTLNTLTGAIDQNHTPCLSKTS
jgi:glycosyltransferase involved in cell wall biosynthesis